MLMGHILNTPGQKSDPEYHTVTAWVKDDDGAMASLSAIVKVRNRIPGANISYVEGSLDNLMEGDTLNLGSIGTNDTDTDLLNMAYAWRFEWRGEQDLGESGPSVSITDLPAGTWTINLTITDDDLSTDTMIITIQVFEIPPGRIH